MSELVTWLTARLDEDQSTAEELHDVHCSAVQEGSQYGPCECGYPARVLVEVEAKRAIVAHHSASNLYESGRWVYCEECGDIDASPVDYPCRTLRLLAVPFADRPGFDETWRP